VGWLATMVVKLVVGEPSGQDGVGEVWGGKALAARQ
jgi:hypothetical protein